MDQRISKDIYLCYGYIDYFFRDGYIDYWKIIYDSLLNLKMYNSISKLDFSIIKIVVDVIKKKNLDYIFCYINFFYNHG